MKSKVEEFLLLSYGVFENNLCFRITDVYRTCLWCESLSWSKTWTEISHFSCAELQANVAALERSLADEKERCSAERQRRKELHNALVVRTDSSPRTCPYIRQKLLSSLLCLLQELRGNIRVHCRVRPVLPFDDIQSSFLGSGWVQNHHQEQDFFDAPALLFLLQAGILRGSDHSHQRRKTDATSDYTLLMLHFPVSLLLLIPGHGVGKLR